MLTLLTFTWLKTRKRFCLEPLILSLRFQSEEIQSGSSFQMRSERGSCFLWAVLSKGFTIRTTHFLCTDRPLTTGNTPLQHINSSFLLFQSVCVFVFPTLGVPVVRGILRQSVQVVL